MGGVFGAPGALPTGMGSMMTATGATPGTGLKAGTGGQAPTDPTAQSTAMQPQQSAAGTTPTDLATQLQALGMTPNGDNAMTAAQPGALAGMQEQLQQLRGAYGGAAAMRATKAAQAPVDYGGMAVPTQAPVPGTNLMGLPSWFKDATSGGAWSIPQTPAAAPPTPTTPVPPPAANPTPTTAVPPPAAPAVPPPKPVGKPPVAATGPSWAPQQGPAPNVSFLPANLQALLKQNPASFIQGGKDWGQTMRTAGQTPQQQQAIQDYVRWQLGEMGYNTAAADARDQYNATMNRRSGPGESR